MDRSLSGCVQAQPMRSAMDLDRRATAGSRPYCLARLCAASRPRQSYAQRLHTGYPSVAGFRKHRAPHFRFTLALSLLLGAARFHPLVGDGMVHTTQDGSTDGKSFQKMKFGMNRPPSIITMTHRYPTRYRTALNETTEEKHSEKEKRTEKETKRAEKEAKRAEKENKKRKEEKRAEKEAKRLKKEQKRAEKEAAETLVQMANTEDNGEVSDSYCDACWHEGEVVSVPNCRDDCCWMNVCAYGCTFTCFMCEDSWRGTWSDRNDWFWAGYNEETFPVCPTCMPLVSGMPVFRSAAGLFPWTGLWPGVWIGDY
jgi:hypothetical protein